MQNDFFTRCKPRLQFLDEEHKQEIHHASLTILERTGVIVHEDEALELLRTAGCDVNDNTHRVRIPSFVVEDALRSVPSKILIYDRLGNQSLVLEDRKTHFGTGSDTPYVIDFESAKRRKAILKDVERAARLADGLDNVDFIMCMGLAGDVPTLRSDRYHFAAMLSSSTKPVMFTAWDLNGLKDIYEMAVAIAGDEKTLRRKPFLIHFAMGISPLIHPKESLQKVLFCAEKRIPVEYNSVDIGGATSPATLAGSVVQGNAMMLSGIVIHQLKASGAPLIVTASAVFMDMRTSVSPYFAPEIWKASAISKEMAMFYRIPTWGKAGAGDAKVLDQQAGIEIGISILIEELIGDNLIHDMGYLESGLTANLESLVICNEVVDFVRKITRGVDFSSERLALDLIDQVGPEGNYLTEKHTLKHFRNEFWFPQLLDHNNYDGWLAEGGKTLAQKAHQAAEKILRDHTPEPLDSATKEKFDEILQRGKDNL